MPQRCVKHTNDKAKEWIDGYNRGLIHHEVSSLEIKEDLLLTNCHLVTSEPFRGSFAPPDNTVRIASTCLQNVLEHVCFVQLMGALFNIVAFAINHIHLATAMIAKGLESK